MWEKNRKQQMSLPMIIKTLNEKKKNKIVTTMSKLANKI